MQKPKKNALTLLGMLLVTLATSCTLPDPPNEFLYTIDFPRARGIGFRLNSAEGPDFKTFEQMDKYACFSPESKALYDNYVKDLRRRASKAEKQLSSCKSQ